MSRGFVYGFINYFIKKNKDVNYMRAKFSNIQYTVRNDLCTGCGVCQGACPSKAISVVVKNGEFRPQIESSRCNNAKGCHRCFDSCPGVGINLIDEARKEFSEECVAEDKYMGRYLCCYTGYSNDAELRYHAASGGSLSQFLIWLLENDKIDGAVVTKFDKDSPLKVKTFVARTKEEIISAKSSKYAPTTLDGVIDEIKNESKNRFVIVGVPCQIEGVRKILSTDKRLKSKICGLFSIYCSGTRSFGFTEYVMKERGINLDELDYLAYRDNGCLGGLVAKGPNTDFYEDYQSYCHPLRSIFFPGRCLLCSDHFGELADISFGDIHKEPYSNDKVGVNSIITRSMKWDALLKAAQEQRQISLFPIAHTEILSAQKMAYVKKKRNVAFSMIRKRLGMPAPDFGSTYGMVVGVKTIVDFFQISIQRFIGRHKRLWFIIPFFKAKVNIH